LLKGLAMGEFANLHKYSRDPVLCRLVQLVMTDEAFHHKFGKIWADKTIANLLPAERDRVEDWAAECFESLLFNLVNIR
ncbi:MAG: ferritin-like domain-containing protein, partial [Pseudomonadota bacterium]|nr:ferritin-like domain-containing protein [Pseudomonadota bacterium]